VSAPSGLDLPLAGHAHPRAPARDAGWQRAARMAVVLSWASLVYMGVEGGVGVWQGAVAGSIALVGWGLASFIEGVASAIVIWRFTGSRRLSDNAEQGAVAGSIALVGWGLASFIEGVASAIVIWRFTGSRRLSENAEQRAQQLVALQFFVLAPYVLVESIRTLVEGGHAGVTVLGMALTATSVTLMPLLGVAKHRLADRLGSTATAGEGTQNVLCGVQAAAVLVGLAANAAVGAWWLDPLIGLFIAFVAVKEGREAWRGETCCGAGCDCG